jgi:CheY-like chemotaxis protein
VARILVVDDNSAVRDVVKTILSRSGFEVISADSGSAAVDAMNSSGADLVLLDIEMPGMSGYDVCAALKAEPRWAQLPIVLMTGRAISSVPDQAKAVGASEFLAKPFDRATLVSAIQRHLPAA